jgi:hypothetical protein
MCDKQWQVGAEAFIVAYGRAIPVIVRGRGPKEGTVLAEAVLTRDQFHTLPFMARAETLFLTPGEALRSLPAMARVLEWQKSIVSARMVLAEKAPHYNRYVLTFNVGDTLVGIVIATLPQYGLELLGVSGGPDGLKVVVRDVYGPELVSKPPTTESVQVLG